MACQKSGCGDGDVRHDVGECSIGSTRISDESIEEANLQKTHDHNFDDALAALLNDLRTLTTPANIESTNIGGAAAFGYRPFAARRQATVLSLTYPKQI